MTNTLTKRNLRRERLIWLTFLGHSPSLREVPAGTEDRRLKAETTKECYLLSHSLAHAQLAVLVQSRFACLGVTRCGLVPQVLIISVDTVTDMATGQPDPTDFSNEVPSTLVALGFVTLVIKTDQYSCRAVTIRCSMYLEFVGTK